MVTNVRTLRHDSLFVDQRHLIDFNDVKVVYVGRAIFYKSLASILISHRTEQFSVALQIVLLALELSIINIMWVERLKAHVVLLEQ